MQTEALSGRVFTQKLFETVQEQKQDILYSRELESLARNLDVSDTMSFIDFHQGTIIVSFSKDNGKSKLAGFVIPTDTYLKSTTLDNLANFITIKCRNAKLFC